MPRRIKKGNIRFISLCQRGANRMPVIYKSDDGGITLQTLVKASDNFDDNGEITAVVYAPENFDSQGDVASAEVIKQMAYDYMREGKGIDIRHNEEVLGKDKVFVAENFIVQKGDPRFADYKDYEGLPVDVTGAWAVVLKVEDPELRKLYREGEWAGVSMGGTAEVEAVKDDSESGLLRRLLNRLTMRASVYGDIEMTGEELKTALAKNNETLAKSIVDGLKDVLKPEAPATTPATTTEPAKKDEAHVLKFEGEPTVENLRAFRQKVAKQKLIDAIDWNDPASIEKAEEEIAKLDTPAGEAEGEGEEGEAKPRAVATRKSGVPSTNSDGIESGDGVVSLTKEGKSAASAMLEYLGHKAS